LLQDREDQHTLEDYWKVVWRRKWLVGLFVLITTLATVGVSFLMTPIYEASATLHLKEQKPSLLGGDFLGSGVTGLSTREEINTQVEILKSRSVLEKVIKDLDLIEKFEVEKELPEAERFQLALDKLRADISVRPVANTRLIRVTLSSKDPELARDMANTISSAFIERDVESKRGEANSVLAFVSGQVDEVSERLMTAEEDLLRFKEAEGISILSEEARLKVGLLAQLESSFQEVKVERDVLNARIAAVLSQMGPAVSAESPLADASTNPAVRRIQDRLAEAQMELARLEGQPSLDSQRVTEIKAQIESLKSEIQIEIESILTSGGSPAVSSGLQMRLAEYESQNIVLAAREDALGNLINVHEREINKLPAREISLVRLERARRINDELYAALMRAKNEAQIEAASQIANIDVVDSAVTPLKPVRPRKTDNGIIALVVSLLLGVVLAFFLEYLDNTVKTEDEVRKLLGIPIIGIIPHFDLDGHRDGRVRRNRKAEHFALVSKEDPESPFAEAFRMVRTNLQFVDLDKGLRTIVVTSPIPGDGKTTVAANIAIALAVHEEKVLVVDADFRIPAIHKIFDLPGSPGVTNILSEGRGYQSVIHKIEGVVNLDVLTTGPIPANSSGLLTSSKMKKLIEELKENYDRVIFDVPPVLVATDALDLASILDGTLLVLRLGEIDRRAVRRMRDILDTAKIRILGGVLNSVDVRDNRYGYGYYYYYQTAERKSGSKES
jgi:succinoglycan biosynthesis transport protein ExoP